MLDRTNRIPDPEPEADLPTPDVTLQSFDDLRQYMRSGMTPWRVIDGWKQEFLCDRGRVTVDDLGIQNGVSLPLRAYRVVSSDVFARQLRQRFSGEALYASVDRLRHTAPDQSAAGVLSGSQKALAAAIAAILGCALWFATLQTIILLNIVVTTYFFCAIAIRFYLLCVSPRKSRRKTPPLMASSQLPTITILLPLYRDWEALPALIHSIAALDYPANKLDVKLLLEEDDVKTQRESMRFADVLRFETVVVPAGGPKTKPKACNFGMQFARGDLIVIYDAEDQPEHDQLWKAAASFREGPGDLACVQAKLNYYNRGDNWLTRLFALEYALWFDWLLPALQTMKAPIPLGGTSNFLRTDILRKAGGWDPFNVTEDADLGLRLSTLGYRVEILDSTTFEEASCRLGNWIRQRSRWMKGYLQTWLVHMRRPGDIVATTGWRGLLVFQLFVAGNVASALINPWLWGVFAIWLLTGAAAISAAFPGPLLWLNIFALTAGNGFFIVLGAIAPKRRKWIGLSPFALTAPLYWILASFAAYKGLWQILHRPYYWEKTDHMISPAARKKRDEALKARHAE